MKIRILLVLASLTVAAVSAQAATNVSYTATADPNLSPDATDSNGNAVDVWSLTHSGDGTGYYGSFLGNSAQNGGGSNAGAGTSAWGLYAGGGTVGQNEVDIGHTFTGGMLSVGQSVSIQFDAGYVDTASDQYGIRLFGPSNFVLSLSFVAGDTAYRYYDAGGASGVSAGFGYYPDGFTFTYLQTGLTTYAASALLANGQKYSWTGTVNGAPDFIQVYNNNDNPNGNNPGANYDVFANNLVIAPEPGSLVLLACGLGALTVSFRVRRMRKDG